MAREKGKKGKKTLIKIISIIVVIAVVITGLNILSVQNLLKKGNTYNKVEIENQIVPEKDENGNWCFTTDREFKIM